MKWKFKLSLAVSYFIYDYQLVKRGWGLWVNIARLETRTKESTDYASLLEF